MLIFSISYPSKEKNEEVINSSRKISDLKWPLEAVIQQWKEH